MSNTSPDFLVEKRVAQLEAITTRRNELIHQMYQMMRQRHNAGNVLVAHDFNAEREEDDGDPHSFLQKFDLRKYGESACVANHVEDNLFEQSQAQSLPGSSPKSENEDQFEQVQRSTRSQSRATALAKSPSPKHSAILKNRRSDLRHKNQISLEERSGHGRGTSSHHPSLPSDLNDETDEDHDELDLIGSPRVPDDAQHMASRTQLLPNNEKDRLGSDPRSEDEAQVNLQPQVVLKPRVDRVGRDAVHLRDQTSHDPSSGVVSESSTQTRAIPVHPPARQEDSMLVDEAEDPGRDDSSMMLESDDEEHKDAGKLSYSPSMAADEKIPFIQPTVQLAPPDASQIQELDKNAANGALEPEVNLIPELSPDRSQVPSLPFQSPKQYRSTASSGAYVASSLSNSVKTTIIPVPPEPYNDVNEYDVSFLPVPKAEPLSPPAASQHQHKAYYTLPPLQLLPAEFTRKKPTKQRRKDRERTDGRKDKEDVLPLGLNRWSATLNANPVWKKVARSTKCLSTRGWAIAISELRLIRTMERIEVLKDSGKWSFRQPKKQRGIGGLLKTHWDYLLDEMKWMRIDFREERKWKLALAYHLSTAVLEWHSLSSWEERIDCGVCVKWKPAPSSEEIDINLDSEPQKHTKQSLLDVNYTSDDEDMDAVGNERQDVIDPLEPGTMIQDALNNADGLPYQSKDKGGATVDDLTPKREELEDPFALRAETQSTDNVMHILETQPIKGGEPSLLREPVKPPLSGLKTTSKNPILGSKSSSHSINGDNEQGNSNTKQPKINAYAPLREQLVYASADKLFIDSHDLDSLIPDKDPSDPATISLDTLFPELQPLKMLDVAPVVTEIKRKSSKSSDRDDPNKRVEEITHTKLYPIGKFMFSKPTLLGPLQPAKRWKDGHWLPAEENPATPDADGLRCTEESGSELFDVRFNNPSAALPPQPKDAKKRGSNHLWNPTDDMLLKSLIDKYPGNWSLIAECFNGSRLTTPTDRRTPSDCLDRWKEKWGVELRQKPLEGAHVTQDESQTPTTSQMTTRGVKRLASASVSSQYVPSVASGSEPKKRRRHLLLQESIRKTAKKRHEQTQKMLANQRKQIGIHETHNQYAKMPKLTPAELSRMKAEKDARDMQDLQQARRRQEELSRSLLRDQAQRVGGIPVAQTQLLQPQPSQSQTQQPLPQQQAQQLQHHQMHLLQQVQAQAQVNAGQRVTAPTVVPSGRPGTVNISRISSPTVVAGSGPTRLSNQQMLQIQQRAAAQAQQALNGVVNTNGVVNSTHVPSSFTSRDATSSPAHLSPPQVAVNAANSPRPAHEQGHNQSGLPAGTQATGNAVPRLAGNHFFIPNQGAYTPEQLQNALRIQMLQQHLLQQQVQQQQQQQQVHQTQTQPAPNAGTPNGFS